MQKREFKNLSPLTMSKLVSFDRGNIGWLFDPSKNGMEEKQAEGAAFLFNLLNEQNLALLADEVGMGKTIQALSVCAALWKQKPEAKVLVLTPRHEISQNWIREYETFVSVHYKHGDDDVKSHYGAQPVRPAVYCQNLYELVENVKQPGNNFFIGKISSFSHVAGAKDINAKLKSLDIKTSRKFSDGDLERNRKIEDARILGQLLKKEIKRNIGHFDLIIIDEAHYFRNSDGTSLRVNSAKNFFGSYDDKLARNVMLLTATPNHTTSSDIKNIVGYFQQDLSNSSFEEILRRFCLRRYRRLSDKSLMKYDYRKEEAVRASFDNPLSEMFFALYQKKVVDRFVAGEGNRGGSVLGFLEGTEFICTDEDHEADVDKREGKDIRKGSDSDILVKESTKFQEIFNTPPNHPKYDLLIETLIDPSVNKDGSNQKKLVFVRRIASVKEIARRVCHKYDESLLDKLSKVLGVEVSTKHLRFDEFNRLIKSRLDSSDEEDDSVDTEEPEDQEETSGNQDSMPESRALNLFKIVKTNEQGARSTHASNFRLRFSRTKASVFNVFFSPGPGYSDTERLSEPYKFSHVINSEISGKSFDNYYLTCLKERVSKIDEHSKTNILGHLSGKPTKESLKRIRKEPLDTLMTIFWRKLPETGLISDKDKPKIIDAYCQFTHFERESFSQFLERGVLLASTSIWDLYCLYLKMLLKDEHRGKDLYRAFTGAVSRDFERLSLAQLISSAILNFKVISEKVFGRYAPEDFLKEQWTNFSNAQPAYPYSGDTKNKRVIASFNTPFFPDVLVSTSVLQEGVNLQYFCDKIIHYGVAWTPGDNEQRVGRIDRMFSKTERSLNENENARLAIEYPYLQNTIDQDHVANFIYKKRLEEDLIDYCRPHGESVGLNHGELNTENWQSYLRKPENKSDKGNQQDPFPPDFARFVNNGDEWSVSGTSASTDLKETIINEFKKEGYNVYAELSNGLTVNSQICIVDPVLPKDRSQPVFVSLILNQRLSGILGKTVYVLEMKTPLSIGSQKTLQKFEGSFASYYQSYYDSGNVKLCFDRSQTDTSHFGIYAKVEVPVVAKTYAEHLSHYELMQNFKDLYMVADEIEQQVFELDQDLKLNRELKIKEIAVTDIGRKRLKDRLSKEKLGSNWEIIGDTAYLWKTIPSTESFASILSLNHLIPLVRFVPSEGEIEISASIKNDDIQEVEKRVMEEAFSLLE